MLACVRTNYAPSSYATPMTLGESIPQKLRHGHETLAAIERVRNELAELEGTGVVGASECALLSAAYLTLARTDRIGKDQAEKDFTDRVLPAVHVRFILVLPDDPKASARAGPTSFRRRRCITIRFTTIT